MHLKWNHDCNPNSWCCCCFIYKYDNKRSKTELRRTNKMNRSKGIYCGCLKKEIWSEATEKVSIKVFSWRFLCRGKLQNLQRCTKVTFKDIFRNGTETVCKWLTNMEYFLGIFYATGLQCIDSLQTNPFTCHEGKQIKQIKYPLWVRWSFFL